MNIKVFVLSILSVVFLGFSSYSQGMGNKSLTIEVDYKKMTEQTPNLGMGVSNERYLRGAFMVYDDLVTSDAKFKKFEVAIWGEVLVQVKENEELRTFIRDIMIKHREDDRLTISVCGHAMKMLDIKQNELLRGFKVVDNIFMRIFELQSQGYNFLIP